MAYGSGGGPIRAYDLLVGADSVTGFQMARIARERPELHERWRDELWVMFVDGTLRAVVAGEFALEDAVTAHEVSGRGATSGRSYSIREGTRAGFL